MDKRAIFTATITEIHPSKVTKGLYFLTADTMFGEIKMSTKKKHEVGETIRIREQKIKSYADKLLWEEVR